MQGNHTTIFHNITLYKDIKGLVNMSKLSGKYTVIREYRNKCTVQELVQHIIQIHINSVNFDITNCEEHLNHRVNR